MEFRLLGPLEVVEDDASLAVGTGRQRALLALLTLRANELVGSDRLVEELWGESPPATAHKMLHNQVSALRQALGRNGRLETHGSAYRLNVAAGERDVDRFDDLVARGRAQLEADPASAAETLREALGLWRGPPLADLAFESFAQTEIARLEERRWAAFEAWVEAELALGRHAELVAELEAAVAAQPLREQLHGQLMLALYRSGRQAEALAAYRRARTTLVEEIGVEPHAELRALHEAILAQDAALRSAEAELSDDLLALQVLDARSPRPGGEAPAAVVCPFMGLATFDAAHAGYFFGRERLVAALVARLVGSPLLAVIGPSGSGKSSVVRAGLLPALEGGVLPGSERWQLALLRPGWNPSVQLDRVLLEPGERVVLVVDQFEEVFTVCRDERERAWFVDALVELAGDRDRGVQVVLAMRADFYGRCAAYDRLARLVGANHVLVGPMAQEELRRAIEEPARRAGLQVEPALTDALIADVADQPGGLPLLSAALLEQWREREGRVMRRAAYDRTGGVHGAVGRLAEQTYASLSEPQRDAARAILLRLADAGEQDAAFVRRRMPRDELDLDRDEATPAALAALVDSRLVTADGETLEVAHEALLREWPRLRGWLEEDAEGRRLHQRLINTARDWQAADRDAGELYRGARLASTLDWVVAGHEADLNELERAFLAASRAEAEAEGEHQRRTNRRLRALLAGLAAVLVVALVAGVVALNQRGEARSAARVADAQRLSVEALSQERLDQALLSARAAVELDDSPDTRGNLLSVLQRAPATLGVVDHSYILYGAAITSDGRLMAIGDDLGRVYFYDPATRRQVGPPYVIENGLVQNIGFSPDGGTLAVSYFDRMAADPLTGRVDLVDTSSRELRHRLQLSIPYSATGSEGPFVFSDVVFLQNGRDMLVRPVYGEAPDDAPAMPLSRIDGETGAVTGRLQVGRHTTGAYASATADRRSVFVTSPGDDRTWKLDPERMRVERSWPAGDAAGAVSPDGSVFALGSAKGRVRLLDLASGAIRPFAGGHEGPVFRMRFTPDGRTLVTSGRDGRVLVWDVERGTIAERFDGHTDAVDGLDLTGDGRTLITGSADSRAILWDLAGDRRLDRHFPVGRPFELDFAPRGIAVSPDGRTLALTHSDGAVALIDTPSLRLRRELRAVDDGAIAVAFSPDGRLLAVTGLGALGRITLWNARTLAPAGELGGLGADSPALAFSPDGGLLAAAEMDPTDPLRPRPLRVWDVRRRALTAFRGQSAAGSIAFHPSGELIAAAAGQLGTEIRDVRTGRLVARLRTPEPRSVVFSPDGELVFVGQYDGRGQMFSTQSWEPVGRRFEGHTGRITFPEFSRDGRMLVTAAADGTVVLWDVETQKAIGSPLAFAPNTYASAALSPDGSRLYAVSTRGDGVSFAVSPGAWNRHACLVAGRELSAAEWKAALPSQPYRPVCSGG
jgi:DNA-binding SARP family transcriptional activator/WD40 repeat protein